jgi:hypothetical protein
MHMGASAWRADFLLCQRLHFAFCVASMRYRQLTSTMFWSVSCDYRLMPSLRRQQTTCSSTLQGKFSFGLIK